MNHLFRTWVETSAAALQRNARRFKARIGKAKKLCAVIKANAYGHGLLEAAKALQPAADWFAVDNVDEASALKRHGLKKPILVLGWTPSWSMAKAAGSAIRLTVSTAEQIKGAAAAARKTGRQMYLHLKVDTGTTRQGADLRSLGDLAKLIKSRERLTLEGLSTHYANIEDTTDHAYAATQLERYGEAERFLDAHGLNPAVKHTACTAAAILFPKTHFDMVRVGIGLYGLWPSKETMVSASTSGLDFELDPALAWRTRIAQVREVRRGTPVSYGLTETMKRDGLVAVLPIGYADGYGRGLSSVGEVLVRGRRAKVIGRVCMNMTMIDVTDVPKVSPEDVVTLLGADGDETVTAEQLAAKLGTINYEVVTRINPTLPRVLV